MTTPAIPNVSSLTPLDDPQHQWRACPRCNGVFRCFTGNSADICPACLRASKEPKPDGRKRKMSGNHIPFVLTCDPAGEFSNGSQFDMPDFAFSLLAGVWGVGMVFERAGITYTVTGINGMVDQTGQRYYATTQRIYKMVKRTPRKR